MRFAIHPAYSGDEVETFLEQLLMMFDGEGEMLYDKRNQVKCFVLSSGCPVIVKRFKKPILIQRIIYGFFRKTKAQCAYFYAGNSLSILVAATSIPKNGLARFASI